MESKKVTKIEDKNYRLIEMKDSMEDSINNLKKVISEQKLLIEIISSSNDADKFKEFTASLTKQIDHYKDQITTIEKKIQLLSTVIKTNENKEMSDHCSTILQALGVFE